MHPTPEMIVAYILVNDEPSIHDGITNVERVRYIKRVFGVYEIDLMSNFDFDDAITCQDTDMVEACIHLCKLQYQLIHALNAAGYLDEHSRDLKSAWLGLKLQKMMWHHFHLEEGKPTPPFSFIN